MDLQVATIAQRPDLAPLLGRFPAGTWPAFMSWDALWSLYYHVAQRWYAEYVLVAVDPAEPEVPAAVAYSAPFHWTEDELPDEGWDAVVRQATADRLVGRHGKLVSALEITVHPRLRGTGLSRVLLDAMRDNASALGHTELVAPVRPSGKPAEPRTSMAEYARRTRADGLPADPWLRVHARAGAELVKVAPCSMVVPGSLARWREWTGLPFDRTGPVLVPGALTAVHCDLAADHAVYVEPNVWVRHRL